MTLDRRTLLAAGAGAGLVALGGGAWTLLRQPGRAGEPSVDDVLHDPDQPVLGNLQGDLTIAEFFDYQCPFCKRGHPDLMAEVEADGNIRLVMKDWPIFGGASVLAAQMVLGAADHDRYAAAQSALMATPARLTEKDVRATLTAAGHNPDRMMEGYLRERPRWDGLMSRNARQAAALGLQGTPAFIIGHTIHAGALDRDRLRAAIAAARNGA
ncbi:DsbA family protein [Paracoccus sp. T5]|uniref:DsbA family protein n=1 Tax=Paracoccus sp. T5 TaxID=3402161 RepID=UPI003AE19DF5